MSVSALLESLQSRIHAQASILPGLYSQLGLPSSALTDELNELQSKLMQCVDEVIVKRRQAVEDWENRCREAESGIHKLMLSLGQSGTPAQEAGAANVTILPKKFEALDAYRDKLRITFTSKLEQLNSLRGRLVNYTRILGEDFICYRENEETLSELAVPDVTPDAFSKLEKDMIRSRNEISRRLSSLADSFEHLLWLYEELGKPLPSPDPFLQEGSSSNESDGYFFRVFSSYVASPTPSLDGVQPTNELLTWVEEHTNELESVKARRESQIQTMYDELEMLWKRLGVDAEEIDQFVDSWTGSTDAVVEAYEAELERMQDLKRSTMSTFIANARIEIEELWTELMISEEERAAFFPFVDDQHTEELLTLHEEEIKRLKEERRSKSRLLAGVRKYAEICEEEKELFAAASDQSRLLGRGPRDPGRLLREEKMRKRVTKEKPRLEQDLMASIGQWETEHRRQFLIDGQSFLELLSEAMDKGEGGKENKKRARANTVGSQRAPTPASAQRPIHAGGSSSKRTKVETEWAHPPQRSGSVTPTPAGAYYVSSGRQVFAPRNGALNSITPLSAGNVKTPGSSLPRPKSSYTISNVQQLPFGAGGNANHANQYAKLGMGVPTSLTSRTVSTASTFTSRSASNHRRESFRPRASVDSRQAGTHKYAGSGAPLAEVF